MAQETYIVGAARTAIGDAGCELTVAGGAAKLPDFMLSALQDPIHEIHMGVTAENVAARHRITREQQDTLVVESHRRAARAIAEGCFAEKTVPVAVRTRKRVTEFTIDEHVRGETSIESIPGRPPGLYGGGTATAGKASGINDGAAAVILASDRAVKAQGLTPMARLVTYAHAGVDPKYMGIGPVPGSRRALSLADLSIDDIEVIEANEALLLKHVQCSGARVRSRESQSQWLGELARPFNRRGRNDQKRQGSARTSACRGRYALATMCIGGGQDIAAIFESI